MTSLYQHKSVPYLIGNPDDKDLDDMYLHLFHKLVVDE